MDGAKTMTSERINNLSNIFKTMNFIDKKIQIIIITHY